MDHCFYDLCVKDKACIDACWEAQYDVVAEETQRSVSQVLNLPEQVGQNCISGEAIRVSQSVRAESRGKNRAVLKRLTVELDSLKNLDALKVKLTRLHQYDILAVIPTDEHTFQYACEKLDIDIIAIDASTVQHFQLKNNSVQAAIGRGVVFELQYNCSLLSSSSKKIFLATAMKVVRVTRGGSNVMFSSGGKDPFDIRRPFDVENLGLLCGINKEEFRRALLTSNPNKAIARGIKRRIQL